MDKVDLRREYKLKRSHLPSSEIKSCSEQIFNLIKSHFNLQNKTIHVFIPIPKFNEVNTTAFIEFLFELKCTVVTSITHFNPLGLSHCIIDENTAYETDKLGIPCPIEAVEISENKIDVVIIPLLAFDNKGVRVGYGKGLYDRFLAQCPESTLKVGLSFFDPVSRIEDINKHDIALDHAVTPRGVYTFSYF